MKLQLALDTISKEDGIKLVKETSEYIDIIEIGTPMIYKYGLSVVCEFKEMFPNLLVFADMKIMDAGKYEANLAREMKADIVSVLGVASLNTIKGCLEGLKSKEKELLVDLIQVKDIKKAVEALEDIDVDYICVHTATDMQFCENPYETLASVKKISKKAKISVAGGINLDSIDSICKLNPDVVIVGSSITNSTDPKNAAKEMKEIILKYSL